MSLLDSTTFRHMILPAAWLVAGVVAGYISEKIVLKKLRRAAQETSWAGDDIILNSLKGVPLFFFFLLGVYLAVKSHPGVAAYEATIEKTITAILLLVGTIVLARISTGLVRIYSQRIDGGFFSTSIFANLTKISVLILGALMILQHLNISITPILTALGVGGLAVALALQDTLANLFAGLHIVASKQLIPGNYIRLSTGEEGFITDITWRNTNIRALSNTITIIPNAQLAKAIVTNYDLPEKELAVLVEVGVDYGSDLDKVEKVTMEEAATVMNDLEGGITAFAPFIRYHTFADSSINFTVILRGRQFVDQYLIKHEFMKRLHRRYIRENIRIPFPIRTVHLESNMETKQEA